MRKFGRVSGERQTVHFSDMESRLSSTNTTPRVEHVLSREGVEKVEYSIGNLENDEIGGRVI
jgi:hypothetical protein